MRETIFTERECGEERGRRGEHRAQERKRKSPYLVITEQGNHLEYISCCSCISHCLGRGVTMQILCYPMWFQTNNPQVVLSGYLYFHFLYPIITGPVWIAGWNSFWNAFWDNNIKYYIENVKSYIKNVKRCIGNKKMY